MQALMRRFGIIIPSFNDERIMHSIASVKAADLENITRIYIIDGLSKRPLVEAMKGALRQQDVLISEPDRGIFDALNKGLERVAEDYVGWLGADDFYTYGLNFSELLSDLDSNRLDVILMDTVFVDEYRVRRRTIASSPTVANYRSGLLIPHFSSFWRSATIADSRFDIAFKTSADQGFFLGLIASRSLKYRVDNRVGLIARLGGASTGSVRRIVTGNLATITMYRRHMGLPVAVAAVAMKLLRKIYWSIRVRPYPIIRELTNAVLNIEQHDRSV